MGRTIDCSVCSNAAATGSVGHRSSASAAFPNDYAPARIREHIDVFAAIAMSFRKTDASLADCHDVRFGLMIDAHSDA